MTTPDKKKKSTVILFVLGFVVVVFVTLLANWRSALVSEVPVPS